MYLFLGLSLALSLILLFGATEIERRDIVARRIGANGRVMLGALFFSAATSLLVAALASLWGGWICFLGTLAAAIAYHGFMGIFLVHGLQETSARVHARHFEVEGS